MSDLVPVLLSKVETIISRSLMCGSSMLPSVEEVCEELSKGGVGIDSGVIDNVGKVLAQYQTRLSAEYQEMQNDSSRMLRVKDFRKIKEELWAELVRLKTLVSDNENDILMDKDSVHSRVMVLKAISSVLEVEGKTLGDIKGDGAKFQAYINNTTFNMDKDKVVNVDKMFKNLDEETKRKVVLAMTEQVGEVIDVKAEAVEESD
jgi:hypothetical protein